MPDMPDMRWWCALCPDGANDVCGGLTDVVTHMEQCHGMQALRWPDGALVVDMSGVPELIDGVN